MNLSALFIRRPVATTLLTIGLALSGMLAFWLLPVSPLPQIDFPTIQVAAALPGANPETMATSVAAPLERQFGRIAGLTEMTSTSYLGSTAIVLQTWRVTSTAPPATSRRRSTQPEVTCRRHCRAIQPIAR